MRTGPSRPGQGVQPRLPLGCWLGAARHSEGSSWPGACCSGIPRWAQLGTGAVTHPPPLTVSPHSPRWLSYLLLFILDLVICLVACLGLARRSRCLLVS